jgi:hypothetical protein
MGSVIARSGRPAHPGLRRVTVFLLVVAIGLVLLVAFAGPAAAQEVPPFEISQEEAPELDYSFVPWTAVLTFGLLIAFFVMLFVLSEKEFKGVINERFGPKK